MDVLMPQLGETVTEGTVTAWHKKVGERVARNETLFDVATDKVDTEVPAPTAGIVAEILVPEGATVAVGTRLAVIAEEGGTTAAAPAAASAAVAAPRASTPAPRASRGAAVPPGSRNRDGRGRVLSPVVRRLAAEHGFDPASIDGSGAGGRVTRRDVMAYLAQAPAAPQAGAQERAERTVIPMSRIRKLTAEHMVRSKATSPHVLQAVEAEFHRIDAVRRARGADWRAREGFSLTYLPFIARAVCLAIPDFPRVNASVEGDGLVVHGRVHLGIAVDLGLDGLVVPVVRDADAKALADLARAIHALAAGARAGTLGPDAFAGGTYTISNSGSFGTLITAPIINQPQVAILSTDGVRKRPVVVEGPEGDAIAIRPVGILAQSFDHRAIDGAYSAAFLGRLRALIETHDWEREFA